MKLNRHRAHGSAGIMLIECMVYLGVFTIVIGVGFAVFFKCSDNYVGLRRNAEEITQALHAGERWREDVRHATGPAAYSESDSRAIWRIPGRDADVYYLHDAGSIWRFASSNSVPEEVLSRVSRSDMRDDDRQGVVCYAWTVELKTERKAPTVRPLFHFLAVPRPQSSP